MALDRPSIDRRGRGLQDFSLCQYADIVGRERVIAGADCGFGSFAGYSRVDAAIAYKKLSALAEGAARASDALWRSAIPRTLRPDTRA